MNKFSKLKEQLAKVFDSDLSTKQWNNYCDYFIIGLIILSTLSVFISTFQISPSLSHILYVIDIITVVIFTIEVTCRIWVADLLDPKFKGFWGRIKYCFTFYGFIDIISTYSFYISFLFPFSYTMLRSLRIVRLLRVFRYMRSFRLLQVAMLSKSKELFISLQFLIIVTLMLSFVLFFYENEAQPGIYSDGLKSVVWAFAQYIGDPGGFAEYSPITFQGRIIANIIGILGIALFAVPTGLIGSAFSEVMEKEMHEKEVDKNIERLKLAFERKLDRPTGFQIVPQHLSIFDIQARVGLKPDDIFDAIEKSNHFRLINLAATQTIEECPQDKLAVEHFMLNRPYGCCIDRGSKVTIVSVSSVADACIGNFSYYVALIGGFNYISREIGELRPYRSYYSFSDRENHEENLPMFMDDLEKLTSRKGSWMINLLVSSGANEPTYPTIFHFSAGGPKGDETFEGDNLFVEDMQAYRRFFEDFSKEVEEKYDMKSDHQRYHNCTSPKLFMRQFAPGKGAKNNINFRVAWSACLWDSRRIAIAKTIADVLNRNFEKDVVKEYARDLKIKKAGY